MGRVNHLSVFHGRGPELPGKPAPYGEACVRHSAIFPAQCAFSHLSVSSPHIFLNRARSCRLRVASAGFQMPISAVVHAHARLGTRAVPPRVARRIRRHWSDLVAACALCRLSRGGPLNLIGIPPNSGHRSRL